MPTLGGMAVPSFLCRRPGLIGVAKFTYPFSVQGVDTDRALRRQVAERHPSFFGSRPAGSVAGARSVRPPGDGKDESVGGAARSVVDQGKRPKPMNRRRNDLRFGVV